MTFTLINIVIGLKLFIELIEGVVGEMCEHILFGGEIECVGRSGKSSSPSSYRYILIGFQQVMPT